MSNKHSNPAAKAILPTPESTSAVEVEETDKDATSPPSNAEITSQQTEQPEAPASIRPATEALSAPEPAAARPASQVAAPKNPVMGRVAAITDAPFPIPCDPAAFSSFGAEVAQDMVRKIACQIVQDLKGCIGVGLSFEFKKGQTFLLPKWFALSYPRNIVTKE